MHVCYTFSGPATQASLPQGKQIYLPLRMFDYVALDRHTCLKPSSYVCNSFTRLAGMLQYPCFKRCFEATGMFVASAPHDLKRHLQLKLTSMHVCKSCIYQQICLNQLPLTNNTSVVVWLNQQAYILHLLQTRR